MYLLKDNTGVGPNQRLPRIQDCQDGRRVFLWPEDESWVSIFIHSPGWLWARCYPHRYQVSPFPFHAHLSKMSYTFLFKVSKKLFNSAYKRIGGWCYTVTDFLKKVIVMDLIVYERRRWFDLFVLCGVRLVHQDDCLDINLYPLITHKHRVVTRKCSVCHLYISR